MTVKLRLRCFRRAAFILSLLALPPVLGAGDAAAEPPPPSVDRILDFFHTQDMLGDALPTFTTALARRRREAPFSETQQRVVESLAKRIYPPGNMLKIFKLAYTKAITAEAVTGICAWINTPRGIQYRKGMTEAYKAKVKGRQLYWELNSDSALKPNRKNAIRTFVAESQQDQQQTIMISGMDYNVLMGLSGFVSQDARDLPQHMHDNTAARRSGYDEAARDDALKFDFYLFKEMKNAEVDELTAFYVSVLGQTHTRAYLKALEATLDAAANTLLQRVIKETK